MWLYITARTGEGEEGVGVGVGLGGARERENKVVEPSDWGFQEGQSSAIGAASSLLASLTDPPCSCCSVVALSACGYSYPTSGASLLISAGSMPYRVAEPAEGSSPN